MSEPAFADIPERPVTPEFLSDLPLVGIDGNAYSIMAQVRKGLLAAGASMKYVGDVIVEMQSGDYDNLLRVAVRYTTPVAISTCGCGCEQHEG